MNGNLKHYFCNKLCNGFSEEDCLDLYNNNEIIASLNNKYSELLLDSLFFYSHPINPFKRWFSGQSWSSSAEMEMHIKHRLKKAIDAADRVAHPLCKFIFQRRLEHWGAVFRAREPSLDWLHSSYKHLFLYRASEFVALGCSEHALAESTRDFLFP